MGYDTGNTAELTEAELASKGLGDTGSASAVDAASLPLASKAALALAFASFGSCDFSSYTSATSLPLAAKAAFALAFASFGSCDFSSYTSDNSMMIEYPSKVCTIQDFGAIGHQSATRM